MNTSSSASFDVLVVGGGPAGLSAALVLGRSCRRVAVIDAGSPRNAATRAFHGYLGRDGADPRSLLRDGREELANYDVTLFDDTVTQVAPADELDGCSFPTAFRAVTRSGRILSGRKILFATGVQDELPEIPGLRECYGVSVHHCPYCDGWEHRGKHLLAYGGSVEAAVGLALSIRTWSDRITVLADGRHTSESDRRKLARSDIALLEERVRSIVREEERLLGVELHDDSVVEADALFFNTAHHPASDLPRLIGCEMEDESAARTGEKQRTCVPGVFVAGDADGDVQFVIVAAAEGATAAVAINRELQDEALGGG